MILSNIAKAVEAYRDGASESDIARLDFFAGLFEIQQERAEEVLVANAYEPLDGTASDAAYQAFEPLLAKAPVAIDETQFFGTCKKVSDYLAGSAGLGEDVAGALSGLDWYKFVGKLDLALAGSNPPEFIDSCLRNFDDFGIDAGLPASTVMMVVAFALRAHIQPAAERAFSNVSRDVKESHVSARPLLCPVCGSPAAASRVMPTGGIDGRERMQFCSMCGTSWPFERMRCGVCGVENPSRLHYFHVEGDTAHRLQNCDECGQYQRVVFEENISFPCVMEVEDVVMAKLDAIALDPRFRAE